MDPLVSILIPAYNCERFIGEAIESALSQNLRWAVELVVVNDGSTDRTGPLLDRLAERHAPHITVAHMPTTRGGGATRNHAITLARGFFLYMLDADNVLPPHTVRPHIERLQSSGCHAASVERVQYFRGNKDMSHEWKMVGRDGCSGLRELFATACVPASHGNYIFTRELFEAVGGYEDDCGAMDTWTFGFKHIVGGYDIALVPGTHYLHRLPPRGRPSYWYREEYAGRNGQNALKGARRYSDKLPTDLAEKIHALRDGAVFHDLISKGAFAADVGLDEFLKEADRSAAARTRAARNNTLLRRISRRLVRVVTADSPTRG